MYDHVLVPVEPTDVVERSIDHAVAIAGAFDATVHALVVREGAGSMQRDHTREDTDQMVEDAVTAVEDAGARERVAVETTVVEGVAENEIVAHAEETGVDLIVMGTRVETGLDGILQGSVAESVLEETTVPVLTVRGS